MGNYNYLNMKKIRYLVVACLAGLWCSCYQGMSLEDTLLDEENVMLDEEPFKFDSLCYKTNVGNIEGRKKFLNKKQLAWINKLGQELIMKERILYKMSYYLFTEMKRKEWLFKLRFALDETDYMWSDYRWDKDGYYDPYERIIFLKDESMVLSERVVIHELLHVFQCELASVVPTKNNEPFMEYEVLMVYDIIQYRMRGELPVHLEGGNDNREYVAFVYDMAVTPFAYDKETLTRAFKKYYAARYSTSEPDYYPGFLIYFLGVRP